MTIKVASGSAGERSFKGKKEISFAGLRLCWPVSRELINDGMKEAGI